MGGGNVKIKTCESLEESDFGRYHSGLKSTEEMVSTGHWKGLGCFGMG